MVKVVSSTVPSIEYSREESHPSVRRDEFWVLRMVTHLRVVLEKVQKCHLLVAGEMGMSQDFPVWLTLGAYIRSCSDL
jgi:hypothetical protein